MSLLKYVMGIAVATALVACGGGGGDPGTGTTGSGTGSAGGGATVVQSSSVGSIAIEVQNAAGIAGSSMSVLEISTAKITLKNANGTAAQGELVTFSEEGAGLLLVAPASGTALTDAAGQASIEIRAASIASIGATKIGATVSLGGQSLSAQKAIAITSAPTTAVVTIPQDLANSIGFLDVNPADKSIVLAGAGGNGRSESATLRFRVVDVNNTPVKGVNVAFEVVPAANVTLNISSAVSDSDGVVLTTVSSKNVATAVVVKATVSGRTSPKTTLSTQSDQLLVTTGVSTLAGFDLSATKFNLNFNLSGDSSDITVRIVDSNGNKVADGVPVVFTANYGAVGSSSRGGCTTVDGQCVVTYTVQNPRPADGAFARVTGATQIGDGSSIGGFIDFRVPDINLMNLYSAPTGGVVLNAFSGTECKFRDTAYVGTPAGFPAAAGTTIEVKDITLNFAPSVVSGSPVLDEEVARTPLVLEFDLSSADLPTPCKVGGNGTATAKMEIKFTAGTSVRTLLPITITYPK